jgi:hypothetical protein
MSNDQNKKNEKKSYDFGGVKEFNLEEIEKEILNETVYLDVFAGSDSRFKNDVKKYTNGLEAISKLDAVTYTYDTEKFGDKNFPKTNQIGFIAQAVETIVPQSVKKDSDGFHYVNYQMLVPVLTEAVKELNTKIEDQQSMIEKLEKRLNDLESKQIIEARSTSTIIEKEL